MNIDIRYDSPEHKISVQDIFSCDKYSMNYAQDACRNASRSLCKTSFSKGRGKAIPLQAWTGPEGSRRMRLLDFKTVEHKGSKVVSPTHWLPLPPRNIPGTHFCYRLSQPQGHSAARSGFSGLEVACWPLVPKFAGSHLAKAVGFLGQKHPQHTFLRRGSKAVGTMS